MSPVNDAKDRIYIGTILLEMNRWGNLKTPTYQVSEWAERFRKAGFDGMELWGYHAALCSSQELKALQSSAFPTAVYNTYCDLDDASGADRRKATEMVRTLDAGAVKFNVGRDPALRSEYLRNLRTWREALPEDCRLMCECHEGTIVEEPAAAARFFDELGGEQCEIIVHCFGPDLDRLRTWFRTLGPSVTHAHVQIGNESGGRDLLESQPDHVRRALRVMKDEGFEGSFTLEFTKGTGEPDESIEGLWQAALADLHFLKGLLL